MSSFNGNNSGWCTSSLQSTASATGNASLDNGLNSTRNMVQQQMKPQTQLNILSIPELVFNPSSVTALQNNLQAQQQNSNNLPVLLVTCLVGLILSIIGQWVQCQVHCCCKRDPKFQHRSDKIWRMFQGISLTLLCLAVFGVSQFAFAQGTEAVNGFRAFICAVQSTVQPFILFGQPQTMVNNQCTDCPMLNNSNLCWDAYILTTSYQNNILFQHNVNPQAKLLTTTQCQTLINQFNGTDLTFQALQQVNTSLVNVPSISTQLTNALNVLTAFNSGASAATIVNTQEISWVGVQSAINGLNGLVGTNGLINTLMADLTSLTNFFNNNIQPNFDMVATTTNISSLSAGANAAILNQMSTSTNIPTFQSPTSPASWFISMIPQNIFQNMVTAPQQATANQLGYNVDFSALSIVANASMQPQVKTISNCVAPTLFGAVVASSVSPTLSSLDTSSISSSVNSIGSNLTPIQNLQNQIAGYSSFDQSSYSSQFVLGSTGIALLLAVLAFLGLLFSLCNKCKCFGGFCICLSWLFSLIALFISQVLAIICMLLATGTNQVCYSVNGITQAPFAQQFLAVANQNISIANTCLYGNGNLVGSLLNTSQFSGLVSSMPIDTFDPLIAQALGNQCGFPQFFQNQQDVTSTQTNLGPFSDDANPFDSNVQSSTNTAFPSLTAKQLIAQGPFDELMKQTKQVNPNRAQITKQNTSSPTTPVSKYINFSLTDPSLLGANNNYTVTGNSNVVIQCKNSSNWNAFLLSSNCNSIITSNPSLVNNLNIRPINKLMSNTFNPSSSLNNFSVCYDLNTWMEDPSFQKNGSYQLSQNLSTVTPMYTTNFSSTLRQGQSSLNAYYNWINTNCTQSAGVNASTAASPPTASSTTAQIQAQNVASIVLFQSLQALQNRIQEQFKQLTQQNLTATGSPQVNPPGTSDLQYQNNTVTNQHQTRSDLLAQGQDAQVLWTKVVQDINGVLPVFSQVVNGMNCSILVNKGLNLILDSMCALDPKEPTLIGGMLSLAFQQLIIVILVMFVVCFGHCYKRQAIDNFRDIGDRQTDESDPVENDLEQNMDGNDNDDDFEGPKKI